MKERIINICNRVLRIFGYELAHEISSMTESGAGTYENRIYKISWSTVLKKVCRSDQTTAKPPRTEWDEVIGLTELYFPSHAKAIQDVVRPFFQKPLIIEFQPASSMNKQDILEDYAIWHNGKATDVIFFTKAAPKSYWMEDQEGKPYTLDMKEWDHNWTDAVSRRVDEFAQEDPKLEPYKSSGWWIVRQKLESNYLDALSRTYANRYEAIDRSKWFGYRIMVQGFYIHWSLMAIMREHKYHEVLKKAAQACLKGFVVIGCDKPVSTLLVLVAPEEKKIQEWKED